MIRAAIRSSAILGLVAAGLLLAPPARASELAVTVNGIGIPRDRLEKGVNAYLQRQGGNFQFMTHPDQYQAVQRQILDVLIGQELLWQEAQAKQLVAPDEEVAQALAKVKAGFDSEQAFRAKIREGGFSEASYTEDLKHQLSVRRLVREAIVPGISVADEEIEAFYAANPEQMRRPEQVRARHVLITLAPGADETAEQAAREKIDAVLAEARGGADFAELAKTHSQGPSAPQGGDLGFMAREQLVKPFADAAFALQPGEISDVVRTRFGYHVIKLEERREAQVMPRAEVAEPIRSHLMRAKVRQAVEERVKALRAQAEIEILVPE